MSKVRDLMTALAELDAGPVTFTDTGGGCFAVRIDLGRDWSGILVTREGDDFAADDLDSDEYVTGCWYVDRYDVNGESVTDERGLATGDTAAILSAIRSTLATA